MLFIDRELKVQHISGIDILFHFFFILFHGQVTHNNTTCKTFQKQEETALPIRLTKGSVPRTLYADDDIMI